MYVYVYTVCDDQGVEITIEGYVFHITVLWLFFRCFAADFDHELFPSKEDQLEINLHHGEYTISPVHTDINTVTCILYSLILFEM